MQVILRKVLSSFWNDLKFSGCINISLKCLFFNRQKNWLSIRGNTRYFRFQRKSIITQNVLILTGWTFLSIYVIPKSICMPIFMKNGSRAQKILTKVCQKWKNVESPDFTFSNPVSTLILLSNVIRQLLYCSIKYFTYARFWSIYF